MSHKRKLTEAFNAVRSALPGIVGNAKPLGLGNFGLVVANPGRTVRKFVFRLGVSRTGFDQDAVYHREIEVLRLFRNQNWKDFEVPVLIGEPEMLDHKDYLATYTMTRIGGTSFKNRPGLSLQAKDARHESAGRILAKFHRIARDVDFGSRLPVGPHDGARILQPPVLSDKTNKALSIADRYLQTHMEAGNIHGDFNMGNIQGRKNIATGVLDFSFSGHSANTMMDFWTINADHVSKFIDGYEQESGKKIDRKLMSATSLSLWTSILSKVTFDEDAFMHVKAKDMIKKHLKDMKL